MHICVTVCWSVSTFFMCVTFYFCLVLGTGALPAEYFSKRKRPDYKAYMARTN